MAEVAGSIPTTGKFFGRRLLDRELAARIGKLEFGIRTSVPCQKPVRTSRGKEKGTNVFSKSRACAKLF